MSRLRLNPLTGLFDYDPVIPPDYVSAVADTASVDLDVSGGVLTATVIPGGVDHGGLAGLADDDHPQYYNLTRLNTWLTTKTTTDLAEGANLYFTDERVDDRVAALIQDSATIDWVYDDTLGTLTGSVIASAVDHGSLSGLLDDDHPQYHTDARALTWLGTRSTTDLAEGTNLYFTTARARASLTSQAGTPIIYNPITGEIGMTIVPITYGGTGSSNAQAAINGLSNSASTAVEGDVFQWLGGNAQFAPLVIPALTGTPNTLAYYNSSGDLINYNYWQASDDGRIGGSFNYTGDGQSILRLDPNVAITDTWNSVNLLAGNLNNAGILTGFNSLLNLSFIDNAISTEFINGLNIGLQGNVTNDKQYASWYSSGTVGNSLSGLYMNSDDDVTNSAYFVTVNRTGTTGAGLSGFELSLQPSADVGGNLAAFSTFLASDISDYVNIVNAGISGNLTKGLNVVNANVSGMVGDGTGTPIYGMNLFIQNTATVNGSVNGGSIYNNSTMVGNNNVSGWEINNQGTNGYRFSGFNSYNTANLSEEIRGLIHNTVGDSRTSTGVDIYMEGNATDDATGLRINVNNQTSTTQRIRSYDIQGHTSAMNGTYTPGSSLFVDTGHNVFTAFNVLNGSPLTNTDTFTNGNIVAYSIQDDLALGPVGLGANHSAVISLVGVADTKTVDLLRNLIVAASIQTPGFADNGTVTEFQGIVYAGVLPGGGNTLVTNATGLIMPTGFDGYATNNWGMRIQGTTAHNYVNKLAIGTGDELTDSGFLLEVQGKILAHDQVTTDVGFGLTVLEGSDAKMGLSTLVLGTITVSTTAVTANSRIFLTNQNPSVLVGVLAVDNIVPGTSFDIISSEPTETSDIAWLIIEAV